MTQPRFVPITEADQVRGARRLSLPEAWTAERPAELHTPRRPALRGMGTPGPDQGFALRLARRLSSRFVLTEGESVDDVVVGCAVIASRRAGLFGRAPSVHDVMLAMNLWGLLADGVPSELVTERTRAFKGAAHDYVIQRNLVDRIPEESLRLTPDEAAEHLPIGAWSTMVGAARAAG